MRGLSEVIVAGYEGRSFNFERMKELGIRSAIWHILLMAESIGRFYLKQGCFRVLQGFVGHVQGCAEHRGRLPGQVLHLCAHK